MRGVFADTGYWLALITPGDEYHAAAASRSLEVTGRIVVTEFILLEIGNTLCASRRRAAFPELVRQIHADPDTEVIPLSPSLLRLGIDLYSHRLDKNWSVTDCVSFIVMKEQCLTEALTADHHFEQAGFRTLLHKGA